MPEQLADLRQVLAGHDGVARYGVAQIMQAQPAEPCEIVGVEEAGDLVARVRSDAEAGVGAGADARLDDPDLPARGMDAQPEAGQSPHKEIAEDS
ncbi:MAG: hypothetical protein OXF74_12260 [Rhodobacteraceae bacterium]|nr:hypothetical protein [Paracoccaceae bacterium]